MADEMNFLKFIKTLPSKDRSFYLMMQVYKRDLSKSRDVDTSNVISSIYEEEINNILGLNIRKEIPSLPDQVINEDNTIRQTHLIRMSDVIKHENRENSINRLDNLFDEKLGEWASSFSDGDFEQHDSDD